MEMSELEKGAAAGVRLGRRKERETTDGANKWSRKKKTEIPPNESTAHPPTLEL